MHVFPLAAEFGPLDDIRYVLRPEGEGDRRFIWQVINATTNDVVAGPSEVFTFFGFDGVDVPIGPLAPGDYELQVLEADDNRLVVSDPFVVGMAPVTRVQLFKPGMDGRINPGKLPCATYSGFQAHLARNLEADESDRYGVPLNGAHHTPQFGSGGIGPYERLMEEARAFTLTCGCDDLLELAPGYVADREAQQPMWATAEGLARVGLPCVELIWNYWQEEGMLVQTLNHIIARFQNRRLSVGDPLARFDVSPLVPLRSLLWSWVENEQQRLTVRRRAAEYEFEYGLSLIGRAVPHSRTYVERRANFLSAFHTVLHQATVFYKQLDDLTVNADGFPLYEALRHCHLVLSQGTQNQYGEMAVAARAEMLVMQHVLAQPAMRDFLGGRPMTPYPEPWMDRVDSMKAIQGWSDTSVLHFHDLATFGERLVVTIRLGNWNAPGVSGPEGANWATWFRQPIQRYIAAYRAVTGVDLTQSPDASMPSTLIARRIQERRIRA